MPATYVALNATVQMAGFSTKNWDVERDRCELHLHEKTGGVFVTRGEEYLFISPALISHVELRVGEASTQSGPVSTPASRTDMSQDIASLPKAQREMAIDFIVAAERDHGSSDSDIDAVLREIAGSVVREDGATPDATGSKPRKRRAPRT